jgi:cytochrome P450
VESVIDAMTGLREVLNEKLEGAHLASWRGAILLFATFIIFQILYSVITAIYNIYFHPLRKIPGPKLWIALPLVKNLHMMGGHLEFKIRAAHEKYGDVVRLGPDQVNFTCPEAWKDIYGHGHTELPKFFPKGTGMDDGNILYSNASNHFRLRRAMLPAFSDKALRQQEPLIRVYVDLLMKRLQEVADKGNSTNMIRWYNFTTFDLIADLAYGEELHGLAEGKSNMWIDNIENLMKLMPILVLVTISPLLSKILQFVAGPKIRKSQAKHREASEAMAMKRINRIEQAGRGDFMDYMMRSRGEKHEMTNAELVSNCDLLMIAGSETTASLLSGVTYWLLKTPRALKKVTEEVRSVFERDEDIDFKEASARLPYMLACLDEALRIYPSIPLSLSRQTLPGAPTPVAGLMIPENVASLLPFSLYNSLTSARLKSGFTNSQPSTPSAIFTAPKNSSRNAGFRKARTTLHRHSTTINERFTNLLVSDPEIVLGGIWRTTRCVLLWRDCYGISIWHWMSKVKIGMSRRSLVFGKSRL